ncbi:MAG: hypothetical protein WBF66_04395 [Dehalococcoidia bacterium]
MTQEDLQPWFEFSVLDTEGEGVEVGKLTRLLSSLSSSFYAIARAKIGMAGPRPGRRKIAEETLAAIRLVRVRPGSTTIEVAPPTGAIQGQLQIVEEPTPDDVALDFYEEVRRIEEGEPAPADRQDIRRHVRAVVEEAGQIGPRAEIVYRPLSPRPGLPRRAVLRTSIRTTEVPEEKPPGRGMRRRRLSGHAYMVDVEPGRERLRVKLPDGRDITLDVQEELTARIAAALDQVVEVQVEEEVEGNIPISRVARDLAVLPTSGPGSDQPPKSISELEREQNMPSERPDYVALASIVWETEEEIAQFEQYVRELRRAETA